MIFDNSTFGSKEQCQDLFGNAIRKNMEHSVYGNTTVFTAKVLTPPVRLSESISSGFMNSQLAKKLLNLFDDVLDKVIDADGKEKKKSTPPPGPDKFIVRARIDDKDSPHHFLPDPCSIAYANDIELAAKIISMHTVFLSTEETKQLAINPGDIIEVRLQQFADGSYNLEYGEIVGLNTVSAGPTGACEKLEKLVSPKDKFSFTAIFQSLGSWDSSTDCTGWCQRKGVQYYAFGKSLSVLDNSVQADFAAFFAELESMGIKPTINSARRSVKHQWGLYTQLFGKYDVVASPCGSDHQYGFAIDMAVNGHNPGTRERDIAAKHNIKWYGPGDEVHFYHNTSKTVLKQLKKKCRDYYYTKYGKSPKSWPKEFVDELQYIEPPVSAEAAPSANEEENE
jgi:hypothetical protein